MSKSKVHTSKNFNRKCHRNGIKKPKKTDTVNTRGMNQKYLRNVHFTRVGRNKKAEK